MIHISIPRLPGPAGLPAPFSC